ncbi:MAG: DNA metabolism protein [Clostridiaceae bacterium]|nr:DNA metabolism protein [Clostridiaceae bacterium]
MIYLYDGSFEGLLTCVFEAYASKEPDISIIPQKDCTPSFLEKERVIETDMEKFRRVYESVSKKISPLAQKVIYKVWLSEDENASNLIYKFLRIGYKIGGKVVNYIQDPAVNRVMELNKAVGREAHRFLGLLRFREVHKGIFYADYEPQYNITALIAPHFARRLACQPFLIHDKKRNICAVFNGQELVMTDETPLVPDKSMVSGDQYSELWKTFFRTIAIKERKNPRTQMNFMPKKYWKYLTELQQ